MTDYAVLVAALTDALRTILPPAQQDHSDALATALVNAIRTVQEGSLLHRDVAIPEILLGQEINAANTLISFGSGNDQRGATIKIDGVAGRDILHLPITIVKPNDPYDVTGLRNPFVGLSAFTYEEKSQYAGRDALVRKTVEALTTPGAERVFFIISGASGTGKSSFAQAGLLPALEKHYRKNHWTTAHAVFRPSKLPLNNLADALKQLDLELYGVTAPDALTVLGHLQHYAVLSNRANLIILDQFEELFTQSDATQRAGIIELITNLPPYEKIRTHIIATIRDDYLQDALKYEVLEPHVRQALYLRTMNHPELRDAIQHPLHIYPGKYFEPALLEQLVKEAATDASYLPLLQVTLQDLWNRGSLTHGRYSGLADAISSRANQVLNYSDYDRSYPERQRNDTEKSDIMEVFLDLVDVSPHIDDPRDVRINQTLQALTRNGGTSRVLIDDLITARLLTTHLEKRNAQEVVIVAIIHEALIANWQLLHDKIASRRTSLRERTRFKDALDQWIEQKQSKQFLLTGQRLLAAEELEGQEDIALHSPDARDFLRRSRSQRMRSVRTNIAVLSTLFVLLVIALVYTLIQNDALTSSQKLAEHSAATAQTSQQLAEQNEDIAKESALLARSQAELRERYPDQALAFILADICQRQASAQSDQLIGEITGAPGIWKTLKTTDDAQSIAISADGRVLAGTYGGTMAMWDPAKNYQEERTTPFGPSTVINSVVFSSDGKRWAAGGYQWNGSGRIMVFGADRNDTKALTRTDTPNARVTILSFVDHGKQLLASYDDNTVIVWNISDQKEQGRFSGNKFAVSLQDDETHGQVVAYDNTSQTMKLLDVGFTDIFTTSERLQFQGAVTGTIALALSSDNRYLLGGNADRTAHLWDVQSGKELRTFIGHTAEVFSVKFSSDNRFAVTGSFDGTARIWDVTIGREVSRLSGQPGPVESVAFSQDDSVVVAGIADGSVLLWKRTLYQEVSSWTQKGEIWNIAVSPDGRSALSATEDELVLRDLTSTTSRILTGPKGRVTSISFSPQGTYAAAGTGAGDVYFWNTNNWDKPLWTKKKHTGTVLGMAFSRDEKLLITGSIDEKEGKNGKITIWTIADHTEKSIELDAGIYSLDISSNNNTLLLGLDDNTIKTYDILNGAMQEIGRHKYQVYSVGFNATGTQAVSASFDGTVGIWDVTEKRLLHTLPHQAGALSAAFSPDDTKVVTGGFDGYVHLWDTQTGQELQRYVGHTDSVQMARFVPHTPYILSSSKDRTLRLWRVGLGTPLEIEQWAANNRTVADLTSAQQTQYGISATCASSKERLNKYSTAHTR